MKATGENGLPNFGVKFHFWLIFGYCLILLVILKGMCICFCQLLFILNDYKI
jgi:hypothetical protein